MHYRRNLIRVYFLTLIPFIAVLTFPSTSKSQSEPQIELRTNMEAEQEGVQLFQVLRRQDSLLFEVAFNTCDTAIFNALISDDFEFYHDQGGATLSKAEFLKQIEEGLCSLPYRPERRLVEGSMVVHPMKRGEEVYGAIQIGEHEFFANEADPVSGETRRYSTSIAAFTHLWILEEDEWKLRRVLSYAHQPARDKDRSILSKPVNPE